MSDDIQEVESFHSRSTKSLQWGMAGCLRCGLLGGVLGLMLGAKVDPGSGLFLGALFGVLASTVIGLITFSMAGERHMEAYEVDIRPAWVMAQRGMLFGFTLAWLVLFIFRWWYKWNPGDSGNLGPTFIGTGCLLLALGSVGVLFRSGHLDVARKGRTGRAFLVRFVVMSGATITYLIGLQDLVNCWGNGWYGIDVGRILWFLAVVGTNFVAAGIAGSLAVSSLLRGRGDDQQITGVWAGIKGGFLIWLVYSTFLAGYIGWDFYAEQNATFATLRFGLPVLGWIIGHYMTTLSGFGSFAALVIGSVGGIFSYLLRTGGDKAMESGEIG